jgi:hypothetical protein
MAVDYKQKIGFKGQFYIEPKPREPSTHQYDSDAAACLNFLREHNLLDHFKLNLETNHATLAGHSMRHEMQVAIAANALGSVDANTGDDAHRLGHRPVPDEHLPHHRDHARSPAHGRPHHRRSQLRRQVPPRILRAGRSLPRPHRRHGRLRPRPQGRPRDDRRRSHLTLSSSSATPPSTPASVPKSRKAKSVSKNSKPTSSPTANRCSAAAVRRCLRTW